MDFQFPTIYYIDQVRQAIKDKPEFIEKDCGDHIIFNYLVNFENTFPPITDNTTAILRECRGIIFDKETGEVIARRPHKFFNLNERPETLIKNVDFSRPHVMLEKLDGSMITPFEVCSYFVTHMGDRHIKMGTKMGETDIAQFAKNFCDENPQYWEYMRAAIDDGYTPTFEFCSRKNRVVIDHPTDRLVLLAVRHNVYGDYLSYDQMRAIGATYDIEVVKKFDMSLADVLATSDTDKDKEGYVLRFDDGDMLKLKMSHYCQLHRTMEHLQHEKDLIRLILDEKLDDAKPFLPADLMAKVDSFGEEMMKNIRAIADKMAWETIAAVDSTNSKKQYAAFIGNWDETQIRFRTYDFMTNSDRTLHEGHVFQFVYDELINKIKRNLSTQNGVNSVRHLFGNITWTN